MGCESVSVLIVLPAVFGFDRNFFSVLEDFFYGFAVSNRPQCPPPVWTVIPSVQCNSIKGAKTILVLHAQCRH